jgi:hypothetical protein
MAQSEIEVKVDAGAVLHKAMKDFAENFFKDYGVEISSIDFEWAATVIGSENSENKVLFVQISSKAY